MAKTYTLSKWFLFMGSRVRGIDESGRDMVSGKLTSIDIESRTATDTFGQQFKLLDQKEESDPVEVIAQKINKPESQVG